ncbi:MAG: V-type ATPase 116kDa subunit family protein [Candidatus Omnitrophica bacterium]|nr:V-type ATPase 116kDa subunit family protein [Candidatus Omnitrophota bacterium]
MLTTSSMELISVAVIKEKIEELVSRLISLGIFHPVDIRHIEEQLQALSPLSLDKEYVDIEALENSLKEIAPRLSLKFSPLPESTSVTYENAKETFSEVNKKITPLIERQNELNGELKTKESIASQLKNYFPLEIKKSGYYTFLDISLGEIEEKNVALLQRSLADVPSVIYPLKREGAMSVLLVIGLRRDRALIERVLKDLAWRKVEQLGNSQELPKDVEEKINKEIAALKANIVSCEEQIRDVGIQYQAQLSSTHAFIILKKSLLEAKKYSCSTERTVLLAGWVPKEERQRVISEIKKLDPYAFIEEKNPDELLIAKEEIPVRLVHKSYLKPFEMLIGSYGLPRYGSIDPTIFVAISFLVMFGAMFGDLGQGLVLAISAALLHRSRKEKVKQASVLLLYCGISSCIFGLLYGSIFGFEGVIRAFWIKPMNNIMEIFKMSILFGVSIISAGILLNIINAFRDKDYMKAIFDKAGLITGVMYWIAIGLVSKMLVSKGEIRPAYLIIISICLILLFFKPLIEIIFKPKKEKTSIFVSFMESAVDILEVVMGYLANTVSFIRVAAFSLAHAGLFLAIFELSNILKNVAGGAFSISILILGNIFIILLEGLVVCIQSLRLNYYEFFSKFFMAGKQAYTPLTMHRR